MISKQKEKILLRKLNKIEEGIRDLESSEKKRNARIIKRNKNIRFPKTIDILEKTWKIELTEDIEPPDQNSGEKLNGLCQQHNRKIILNLSNKDITETLVHELIHAIDYEAESVFNELKKSKIKEFKEFRVRILARVWTQIFKQLRGNENGD